MKKTVFLIIPLFLAFLFFQSCQSKTNGLPPSTGKTLEIIVVTNNKAQWNGNIGDTIRAFFGQEQIGLPQSEALFSMVNLPEESFLKMYQANRDILILDISNKIKTAQIENKKDLWSSPQRVIKISAPDENSFYKIFNENKTGIMELYNQVERERMQKTFETAENISLVNSIKEKFNFSLVLPSAYRLAKQDSNFMWIRKETLEDSQGILIYSYPYIHTNAFDRDVIINLRNQMTSRYIPGPTDGSFMTVADDGIFAVETRGLWETKGDFMGGPFLSYTFVDEASNRVITLDSYVYAPGQNKRDLLKQLEAILYSFNKKEK